LHRLAFWISQPGWRAEPSGLQECGAGLAFKECEAARRLFAPPLCIRHRRRSEDRLKEGSADLQCLVEGGPVPSRLRVLGAHLLPQLWLGTEERGRLAARYRCTSAVSEIVPDDGTDRSRMAQNLTVLGGADLDAASTDTAGRLNDDVRTKHRS